MFATALAAGLNGGEDLRIRVELYGSLGATGKGHGTDTAVILGLAGNDPETVDIESIESRIHVVRTTKRLRVGGQSNWISTQARISASSG